MLLAAAVVGCSQDTTRGSVGPATAPLFAVVDGEPVVDSVLIAGFTIQTKQFAIPPGS